MQLQPHCTILISISLYLPAVHPKEGEASVLRCKVEDKRVKGLQGKGLMLWGQLPNVLQQCCSCSDTLQLNSYS